MVEVSTDQKLDTDEIKISRLEDHLPFVCSSDSSLVVEQFDGTIDDSTTINCRDCLLIYAMFSIAGEVDIYKPPA